MYTILYYHFISWNDFKILHLSYCIRCCKKKQNKQQHVRKTGKPSQEIGETPEKIVMQKRKPRESRGRPKDNQNIKPPSPTTDSSDNHNKLIINTES